jgi:hypothetical protein
MAVTVGTKTLNVTCGAFGIVLLIVGVACALLTGFATVVAYAAGGSLFVALVGTTISLLCLTSPIFYLMAWDRWQMRHGLTDR